MRESYSSAMEAMEAVSLGLILLGIVTSNLVTRLLYRSIRPTGELSDDNVILRYHSSILYIKRNILTYLSLLLVTSMNLTSNVTVSGESWW